MDVHSLHHDGASNASSSNASASYFFIVDMDVTSTGEIMNDDDISHLSDPTTTATVSMTGGKEDIVVNSSTRRGIGIGRGRGRLLLLGRRPQQQPSRQQQQLQQQGSRPRSNSLDSHHYYHNEQNHNHTNDDDLPLPLTTTTTAPNNNNNRTVGQTRRMMIPFYHRLGGAAAQAKIFRRHPFGSLRDRRLNQPQQQEQSQQHHSSKDDTQRHDTQQSSKYSQREREPVTTTAMASLPKMVSSLPSSDVSPLKMNSGVGDHQDPTDPRTLYHHQTLEEKENNVPVSVQPLVSSSSLAVAAATTTGHRQRLEKERPLIDSKKRTTTTTTTKKNTRSNNKFHGYGTIGTVNNATNINDNNVSNNNQPLYRHQQQRWTSKNNQTTNSATTSRDTKWKDDGKLLLFDDNPDDDDYNGDCMDTPRSSITQNLSLLLPTTTTTTIARSSPNDRQHTNTNDKNDDEDPNDPNPDWNRSSLSQLCHDVMSNLTSWWSSPSSSSSLLWFRNTSRDYALVGGGGRSRQQLATQHDSLFLLLVRQWNIVALIVSVIVFIGVYLDQRFFGSSSSSSLSVSGDPLTVWIDVLYWSMTSLTTIGGVSTSHAGAINTSPSGDNEDNTAIMTENIETSSTMLLISTMIYGFIGVTTLSIAWGRSNRQLVSKYKHFQEQKQQARLDRVFDAFCNQTSSITSDRTLKLGCADSSRFSSYETTNDQDSKFVNNSILRRNVCGTNGNTYQSMIRMGKIWFVPTLAVILTCILGYMSGWNVTQTVYYVVITSFTMSDGNITPTSVVSKIVSIILIPLVMSMTIRWMLTVYKLTAETDGSYNTALHSVDDVDDPITSAEVGRLLQSAQMDDGLLTHADFLELILLATKKVDPDLLIRLRKGFDRVTRDGSIDLTRKEWILSAAETLNHNDSKYKPARTNRTDHFDTTDNTCVGSLSHVVQNNALDWLI